MLMALISVPTSIGYPLLFAFVAAESAGALVPGETALIVAGALAGEGRLSLSLVIAVAAGAAIVGDNVGYILGRKGLRRLVDRPGRWAGGRQRLIARGEEFFARHGAAAVFFGRWLPGLRVAASWLARSEEHTSELQSPCNLVCRLLLEKKKKNIKRLHHDIKKKKQRKNTV